MTKILYWHLWTDGEGTSHLTRCSINHFELKAIQPTADPQWLSEKTRAEMTTVFTVLPVGWTGEWHENPKPQWIIPLSGRWFVEAMDGTRVEMGAGEISFGGDQNCRQRDDKTGHRSGTIGDDPAVLLLVQLHETTAVPPSCASR